MTNMTKLKEAIDGDKLSDKDKKMAIKQLVALSCSGQGSQLETLHATVVGGTSPLRTSLSDWKPTL